MAHEDSLLSDYDAEQLIAEVETRPLLYQKQMPEYSNKSLRDAAWHEISKNFSCNWDDLTARQKLEMSKNMKAKWKHIKDNFRREVQFQKSTTKRRPAKRRKKYRYFDQLQFLLPFVNDELNEKAERNITMKKDTPLASNTPCCSHKTNAEEVMTVVKNYDKDVDEDKTFCISLVPTLKKMDDSTKLLAKIEILSVLRNLTLPEMQHESDS